MTEPKTTQAQQEQLALVQDAQGFRPKIDVNAARRKIDENIDKKAAQYLAKDQASWDQAKKIAAQASTIPSPTNSMQSATSSFSLGSAGSAVGSAVGSSNPGQPSPVQVPSPYVPQNMNPMGQMSLPLPPSVATAAATTSQAIYADMNKQIAEILAKNPGAGPSPPR